jgi:hypothetical protein
MPTTPATPLGFVSFSLLSIGKYLMNKLVKQISNSLLMDVLKQGVPFWLEKASVDGDMQFLGNLLGAVSIWKLLKSI